MRARHGPAESEIDSGSVAPPERGHFKVCPTPSHPAVPLTPDCPAAGSRVLTAGPPLLFSSKPPSASTGRDRCAPPGVGIEEMAR